MSPTKFAQMRQGFRITYIDDKSCNITAENMGDISKYVIQNEQTPAPQETEKTT